MTRQRAGSAEVRQRMLQAGLDLFHSRGYHAVGVQEITNAAGMPKGSFYNHFASKEDLALAALEQYAAQSPLDLLTDRGAGAVAALRAHFEELARRFTESDFQRGCLMGNFSNEIADELDRPRRLLADLFEGWKFQLTAAITAAQAAGEVSAAVPADRLAGLVLSAWEGSLTRARATRNADPLHDFFDTVFDHLLTV
jgi:TetR/AcrR family transcriptional regulator, transcriptional repressor for nem operon